MKKGLLILALLGCLWAPAKAEAAIALDAASYCAFVVSTTQTCSFTVTGLHPTIFVATAADLTTDFTISATWNSVSMTLIKKIAATGGTRYWLLFALAGASTGTHNVVVTSSSSSYLQSAIASFTGTSDITPSVFNFGTHSGSAYSLAVTTTIPDSFTIMAFYSSNGIGSSDYTEDVVDAEFNGFRLGHKGPIAVPASTAMQSDSTGGQAATIVQLVPFSSRSPLLGVF